MARVSFIPHDQDREDQKAEEKAERRAMRNAPVSDADLEEAERREQFGNCNPADEEYRSIEDFVEFKMEDDDPEFTHYDLACLNVRIGMARHLIRQVLVGYGLKFKLREKPREVRGFSSNPHNRWAGNPMCGGGGGGSIIGMAD